MRNTIDHEHEMTCVKPCSAVAYFSNLDMGPSWRWLSCIQAARVIVYTK